MHLKGQFNTAATQWQRKYSYEVFSNKSTIPVTQAFLKTKTTETKFNKFSWKDFISY